MKFTSEYGIDLLKLAQEGNEMAEEQLIVHIKEQFMNRRIGRYLGRNRQVENEDLKQEFLIGVALSIHKAKLDLGDPFEYIIDQGVYRVRTYLRKHIIQGTMQVCEECGNKSRLNVVGSSYVCKKCGSTHNITQEVNDLNEVALGDAVDKAIPVEDEAISHINLDMFESTLTTGTNVTNVYFMFKDGVKHNPNIKNYIAYIAEQWNCSNQNVVKSIDKLKDRLNKFADANGYEIKNGVFIEVMDEEKEGTNNGR